LKKNDKYVDKIGLSNETVYHGLGLSKKNFNEKQEVVFLDSNGENENITYSDIEKNFSSEAEERKRIEYHKKI